MNEDRSELVAVGALLLLGSLAFVHLTALPAFEDEAYQLHLICRAIQAGEWLMPFRDGKPLEAWPMVPLVLVGFHPPLAVTRAVHVVAGMIGAVLTYRLALRLDGRKAAFASGALFALCPFVVYLQRLAVADMFLCTGGLAVLLSVVRFLEAPTWRRSVLLGASLVLAVLCKMPIGFVFIIATPLALVLMPASERRSVLRRPLLLKLVAAHVPVAVLACAVALVVVSRVHNGHSAGFGLQLLLCIGLSSCPDIAAQLGVPRPNLLEELTTQLSVPVAIVGMVGLVAAGVLGDWRRRWLIAMGALPLLAIGLFAAFWFPRYLLFTLPPLIIAAVSGWRSLAQRTGPFQQPIVITLLALCLALLGRQSALLILDPPRAKWSPTDRAQYFEGWSSGYGFPQAAQFILASPEAPRSIYSLDGHSADQLRTYLPAEWRNRVKPIMYGADGRELRSGAERLRNLLSSSPAWIIIPEPLLRIYLETIFGRQYVDRIRLRRVAAFDKPGSRVQLSIYRVTAS